MVLKLSNLNYDVVANSVTVSVVDELEPGKQVFVSVIRPIDIQIPTRRPVSRSGH